MTTALFTESSLRKLDQLALIAKRVRAGVLKGERRSSKKGSSVEFADYRNYVRGDDLRRLDWNLYARLERPFIKLMEEEEDLAVHILLDCSASMDWNLEAPEASLSPDQNKFTYARRLAGAFSYLALGAGDRLQIATIGDTPQQYGPARGSQHTLRLVRWLSALQAGGLSPLAESLRQYAAKTTQPGMCILISDLFSQSDWQAGISALQARGHECVILQILSPDEVSPSLNGDLRLIDRETLQAQEVSLDSGILQAYQQRLQRWQQEIAQWAGKRGAQYLPVNTAVPWEQLILTTLRQRGLIG